MANYATIYFPENNAAESMAEFATLAESLGYTTTRGTVRGNIRGLLQALVDSELTATAGWISVDEPPELTECNNTASNDVLIFLKYDQEIRTGFCGISKKTGKLRWYEYQGEDIEPCEVTHWSPLPNKPS